MLHDIGGSLQCYKNTTGVGVFGFFLNRLFPWSLLDRWVYGRASTVCITKELMNVFVR